VYFNISFFPFLFISFLLMIVHSVHQHYIECQIPVID